MVEENMTQTEVAKKIGISLSAFNAKMVGKREFTVQEAAKICDLLGINEPREYFFCAKNPIYATKPLRKERNGQHSKSKK